MTDEFGKRISIEEVEEGKSFTPKFDENGLIPVITVEDSSGDILMHGYMNSEALIKSIESREAHYWSRSRQTLWKKGESSGMVHKVDEILIDDDQDSVWLKVSISGIGASCHVGYKSCFYRSIESIEKGEVKLNFTESEKVFDPEVVYPGFTNPTKL